MSELIKHTLHNYTTERNIQYDELDVSYQLYGRPVTTAPIVLVTHALTGNSDLNSPSKGWWREIVGEGKLIDTNRYTVIAFNIPGNGYDDLLIENYQDFVARDIAEIFYQVLRELNVNELHAAIGGSLGGGISWELAAAHPTFVKNLIPIAADWKSTDWIIGHNSIQESILHNSKKPLEDARKMAMLFYRTPISFSEKFNRTKKDTEDQFNVASWLEHHGRKLNGRFDIKAYLMMNHLLTYIDITKGKEDAEEVLKKIEAKVIQIAIDSDIFFVKEENIKTQEILKQLGKDSEYFEVKSSDGHDAFLIEHEQITQFLQPYF